MSDTPRSSSEKPNLTVDQQLHELEARINKEIQARKDVEKNGEYRITKEGSNYFLNAKGIKLEFPFNNPEKLVGVAKLVERVRMTYAKGSYNGAKLYLNEDWWSAGDHHAIIDIRVDNRIASDTTFLSNEAIRNTLGINISRADINNPQSPANRFVRFLNQILA